MLLQGHYGLLSLLPKVLLIVSGNLSFLNWLTIVPSIACFDDAALGFLFSSKEKGVKGRVREVQAKEAAETAEPLRYGKSSRNPGAASALSNGNSSS